MPQIRFSWLFILIFVVLRSVSLAANYYVDDNPDNNAELGTFESPWKTIDKANATLKKGDTVYIREGIYTGQQIKPKSNGDRNQRIVYRNYENETVTITDSRDPLVLSDRSYVTVHGLNITNCDRFLTMNNGHHNHLEYLNISNMRNYDRFEGFLIGPNASYNWIHHNNISRYGYYSGSEDYGDMVYIGKARQPGNTHHNLIENNHLYHGGHNVISVNGNFNVIRNNYFHNEPWSNGYGNRITSIRDDLNMGRWNLFENNRYAFSALSNDNNGLTAIQCTSNNNIFRKNMFYDHAGAGIVIRTNNEFRTPHSDSNYLYNNVFFYCGNKTTDNRRKHGVVVHSGDNIDGTVIKNNIFYNNIGGAINSIGTITNLTVAGNWEEFGDPEFVNADMTLLDPSKIDYPDFNLKPDSPCIDEGVFLTRTTSSGEGTSIPVEDAHYFMDGWGIIDGDVIQLENQSQRARITGVDYDNNTLKIDKPLSWTSGQGVSLQYGGERPDIGAIESGQTPNIEPSPPRGLRIVDDEQ